MDNNKKNTTSTKAPSPEIIIKVLNQIEGFSSKKMFGGYGLFHSGKMFGLIDSKGVSFLKVDHELKDNYLLKGSIQHSRMPYFSIPADVIMDTEQLVKWARMSINVNK